VTTHNNRRQTMFATALAAAALSLAGPSLMADPMNHDHEHHHHEGDIVIGRTALGQLAIEADLDHAFPLAPVATLIQGWSGHAPGFEALHEDEPDEGFFTLPSGADVLIEVLGIDPGLRIWAHDFSAFADQPGQTLPLGGADLHRHAIWHIDSTNPAIGDDWLGTRAAALRLLDAGSSMLSASDPFRLTFAVIPEPSSAALLLLAAPAVLLACRRRR